MSDSGDDVLNDDIFGARQVVRFSKKTEAEDDDDDDDDDNDDSDNGIKRGRGRPSKRPKFNEGRGGVRAAGRSKRSSIVTMIADSDDDEVDAKLDHSVEADLPVIQRRNGKGDAVSKVQGNGTASSSSKVPSKTDEDDDGGELDVDSLLAQEEEDSVTSPSGTRRGRRGKKGGGAAATASNGSSSKSGTSKSTASRASMKASLAASLAGLKEIEDAVVEDSSSTFDVKKITGRDREIVTLRFHMEGQKVVPVRIYKDDLMEKTFEAYANKLKLPLSNLLFTYEDTIVEPMNQPGILGMTATGKNDIIVEDRKVKAERELAAKLAAEYAKKAEAKVLEIKIKWKDGNETVKIKAQDPFQRLMDSFGRSKGRSVTFKFDGLDIDPEQTAEDLELEDEDCVDVYGL